MSEYFQGRSVVVTGAARGNGAAIAIGFAKLGATVWACDVLDEELAKTVEGITAAGGLAHGRRLDVTDRDACHALASEIAAAGSISVLVNNAGIIRRLPITDEAFNDAWDQLLSVNATGTLNMVQAFLAQLEESKGAVVNLASIMSHVAGPNLVAYAASKGAVAQLTKALAGELAPRGIRVNAIAPGVISTPMTEATRQNPDAINAFMMHTPLRRPGEPEELVGPVTFLASPDASYVTGIVMPVDGGYLAT